MEKPMSDDAQFPDAEQQRAVALVRSIDVQAPPALRMAVQQQIEAAADRSSRGHGVAPWLRIRTLAPVALTVAAIAVVLVLVSGANGTPTLNQTAALALSTPNAPPPVERGNTLDVSVAGIRFPYWERAVGWRAVGSRTQVVAGRRIVTIYYASPYASVGYAIVPGTPVPVLGGTTVVRAGVSFRVLRHGTGTLVTWQRNGHTCVIAGRSARPATLLALATVPVPQ